MDIFSGNNNFCSHQILFHTIKLKAKWGWAVGGGELQP